MSTSCQRSYHRKCQRRRVGGQKKPKSCQRSLWTKISLVSCFKVYYSLKNNYENNILLTGSNKKLWNYESWMFPIFFKESNCFGRGKNPTTVNKQASLVILVLISMPKNWWKFEFVVLELVVVSGESDQDEYSDEVDITQRCLTNGRISAEMWRGNDLLVQY